jgi:hypothetical protein
MTSAVRAKVPPTMKRARRIGPIAAVAALALAVFAVAVAAAMPTEKTYVTSECSGAAFKPKSIVLTCGDAGMVVTKLQWPQWGTREAHGAGLGEQKVCKPNCAAGKVAKAAMKVVLSQPKLCPQDEKRHFTKLHYKWIPAAPGEGPKQGSIPLPCSLLAG